jgi:DNA-binding response OmpR family regulator
VDGRRETRGAVVVADDEPMTREFVCAVLRKAGFEPFPAADGAACLALLDRIRPRLVVLDIDMPVRGGMDVLASLAAPRPDPRPPVLLATAHREQTIVELAARYGAAGYLVKPFAAASLLAKVDACLRGVRPRPQGG